MKPWLVLALAIVSFAATACSFQNAYEKEAEKITRAVMADDLSPIRADLAPGVERTITRATVAQWADELNAQGKLESVTELPSACVPGWHCFDVQFEKRLYEERMQLDKNGKVLKWQYQVALAPPSQ